jgi:predicted SnoaL-like aldol condensation-catalyzing enzyme
MSDAPLPNRQLVLDFYDAALNDHDVDRAMTFLGDTYIQHNPTVADGPEGFRRFIQFLADRFPDARNEVKMVIADGDLVALQVHSVRVPGTPGRKIVDIFRVADGKVVEHWDTVQDIPETLYPPIHDNGLF